MVEATVSVKDAREAEAEVEKLLKRAKVVEEKYGKPEMIILSVARPTDEAAKTLKDLAEKYEIKLVLGKEIEEFLAVDVFSRKGCLLALIKDESRPL